MGYNGSGVYTLPPGSIVSDGTSADAADLNTPLEDLEDALNLVHISDGRKAAEANWPMGGYKLTGLASGSAATDSAALSQVQTGVVSQATTVGGTADAITLSFTPVIAAYTSGMKIRWTSGGACTVTNPTVNVHSLGAKTIKKGAGAALAVGDTGASGAICEAVYNGTDFILTNPPGAIYTVNGLTEETTVATGDFVGGYDVSGTAERKFKVSNLATAIGAISVIRRQVFTSSGTYTPHANMVYCDVTATGGGAGGSGAYGSTANGTRAGSGGGAGATAKETFSAATIGASQTVTIGDAGTAGPASATPDGGNGGATTFGALLTANGGTGGVNGSVSVGGAGGTASGGDINLPGQQGGNGFGNDSSADNYVAVGGDGGNSHWGHGGRGGVADADGDTMAGTAGSGYGAGGGGGAAVLDTGGASDAGGAGVAGFVEVIEYCTA